MRLNPVTGAREPIPPLLAVILLACALAGCGDSESGTTPAACLGTAAKVRQALRQAPGPVRLDGGVPISDCIPRNQGAGPQEVVGRRLLLAATELAGRRAGGDSEEVAMEAGYLVGALERGAEDSDGIHATLVDRVTTAASNGIESESADVRAAYERGVAAGEEDG